MKKILISQRILENEGYPEIREAIDLRWGSVFEKAGLIPIPALSTYTLQAYFEELSPDGLLLSGGNDLSHLTDSRVNRLRDGFEKDLLTKAIGVKMPVLGVCRGMQFIAHFFGANLEEQGGHVSTVHEIRPVATSRYKGFDRKRPVNSYHGFGLKEVSGPLRALMVSGDGSVEAFEHDHLPIVGIMWHPERSESLELADNIAEDDIKILQSVFGVSR